MAKNWRIPLYLFFFGFLTLVSVFLKSFQKTEYLPSEVLGQNSKLFMFVEPDDGKQPLVDLIDSAQREIFLTVYLLSDPDIKSYLSEADKRGLDVRVILEKNPFGTGNINPETKKELENSGVEVRWSSPKFTLTHEKTIIIDGNIVCIMNMNLTKTAFTKNREYNICDQNIDEVKEARNIFLADWEQKGYSPSAQNLIVSPNNSRGKLTALIKSATKSLDLEMEVLVDEQMIDLLSEKAKEIPVRLILPPLSKVDANKKALKKLGAKTLNSPYVHAKLIVVDEIRAYIGSVNFSSQSLDQNRELGILISQSDIIDRINQTFNQDWADAQN